LLAWKLPEFDVFPPPEDPVIHVIVAATTVAGVWRKAGADA